MAVPANTFLDSYKDEVKQMKRHLLDYVKMLQTILHPEVPQFTGTTDTAQKKKTTLNITADGFPILPTPWRPEDYTKQESEDLMQNYLGQQYSM
jgi:hypothetical protein